LKRMKRRERSSDAKKAVALRYRPGEDEAPKITAKGSGTVAQRIIELARENGVPVEEDRDLVQILDQLDFYQEIPPSVYVVVAEILAFVYSIRRTTHETRSASNRG
jgi:flagellar biosynthesis protein